MGICFSSRKEGKPVKSASTANLRRIPARDPPPEPEVEETVKEVLSETPKPRPKVRPREDAPFKPPSEKQQQQLNDNDEVGKSLVPDNSSSSFEDRSEDTEAASEVHSGDSASLGKSETTATATSKPSASTAVTEKQRPKSALEEVEKKKCGPKDQEILSPAPVAKHQRKRSVSGDFSYKRNQSVAVGCRIGRSSPSPAWRGGVDAAIERTNSAREAGGLAARNRIASGARKDPGERSGRRSESPAGKPTAELRQNGGIQACGGQCSGLSTVRVNGRASPRRIPAREEKCALADVSAGEGVGAAGEGKESLENPLVSLECFIFL